MFLVTFSIVLVSLGKKKRHGENYETIGYDLAQ